MGISKQESKDMGKPAMQFCSREWTIREKFVAFYFFILHILCIFAPFQFTWNAFWVAIALYVITGLFGISISYHRNLSHRSFNLPKWLEYLFAYCGAHAFQGDPIDWVSTHRCHHQYADTEGDPHSPTQGFWFSYIIWFFDSITLTKKVCREYFIDHKDKKRSVFTLVLKYGRPDNVSDLEKQTFYRFIHDTYVLHLIALAILLYVVGGTPFLVWGMGVRIVVFLHTAFLVNSICHSWGKQQWKTKDLSRNNWWLSLMSFGEAWHNNHHAFEYSARIGIEWWQLDLGWYVIWFLQTIGVATDVKQPSESHKQRLAMDKPKEGVSKSLK